MAGSEHSDVLVVGGGPAGTALASALARRGLDVRVVAPHEPGTYPATYGAWLDDLPDWASGLTAQVWTDVRVYTRDQPIPLQRPYALLDNAALLETLLGRAGSGLRWTVGSVSHTEESPAGQTVHGAGGERWTARLVVDASGHGGLLNRISYPDGPAFQTAWGVVASFDRPPITPGSMVWMDYRPAGPNHSGPTQPRTFLYAMHLGGDRYFVQETSLIAQPGLHRGALEARLHARLEANGTPPRVIHSTEWVAFPMNGATPAPGRVLSFGSAAGLVHPVSGFQVAASLRAAEALADVIRQSLAAGTDPSLAAWDALWPASARAAREVQLLCVRALLNLPGDALPAFFAAFFRLPPAQWRAFLDPATPAGTLARIMLRVFATTPGDVRLVLARSALAQPAASLRALQAALEPTPAVPAR